MVKYKLKNWTKIWVSRLWKTVESKTISRLKSNQLIRGT